MVSRADPNTEFFPGANPHPVMRVLDDGTLIYANASSQPVLKALGLTVDREVPAEWLQQLHTADGPIEVRVGARTFLAVRLPDLRFTPDPPGPAQNVVVVEWLRPSSIDA